jgi:hypothetical protein
MQADTNLSPISSCAQAATTKEAAFRITYPLTPARNTRVVALDAVAARVVQAAAAEGGWGQARFFTAADPGDEVIEVDGGTMPLTDLISDTNSVILVSTTGENGQALAAIGRGCAERSIMTAGLCITPGEISTDALLHLRPYARILLVPAEPDDLPELLRAIRA